MQGFFFSGICLASLLDRKKPFNLYASKYEKLKEDLLWFLYLIHNKLWVDLAKINLSHYLGPLHLCANTKGILAMDYRC